MKGLHPAFLGLLVSGIAVSQVALGDSEIAVILDKDRFVPARLQLQQGAATTLVFTTVNKKVGALVIEPVSIQSKPGDAPVEITRELSCERVTSISFEPIKGRYEFHDALGIARGEIIVE